MESFFVEFEDEWGERKEGESDAKKFITIKL